LKSSLETDLAVRIAKTSKALGLDDEEEMLLWRYLAKLGAGDNLDNDIGHVLANLAEETPFAIHGYSWSAKMPERFYKPWRWFKLNSKGVVHLQPPEVVNDIAKFRQDLESRLQRECFVSWFDEVTACLREDGVNWEPPHERDVVIDLSIHSTSLRDSLRQFM
jgi:hypothetical protein